jgi:hypothetical protein
MVERGIRVLSQEMKVELENARRALRARGHELEWKPNPPASQAEIAQCEEVIGEMLPESFRAFLAMYNGASLSVDHEPGLSDDLIILGTDEIVAQHRRFERLYRNLDQSGEGVTLSERSDAGGTFWVGLTAFAYYGVGYCLFESSLPSNEHYVVLDLDHEDARQTRQQVIASTFEEWFSRILQSAIDSGDFIYWIPD